MNKNKMSMEEKEIFERFAAIFPSLPYTAKENLLFYGEGMARMMGLMKKAEETKQKPA